MTRAECRAELEISLTMPSGRKRRQRRRRHEPIIGRFSPAKTSWVEEERTPPRGSGVHRCRRPGFRLDPSHPSTAAHHCPPQGGLPCRKAPVAICERPRRHLTPPHMLRASPLHAQPQGDIPDPSRGPDTESQGSLPPHSHHDDWSRHEGPAAISRKDDRQHQPPAGQQKRHRPAVEAAHYQIVPKLASSKQIWPTPPWHRPEQGRRKMAGQGGEGWGKKKPQPPNQPPFSQHRPPNQRIRPPATWM